MEFKDLITRLERFSNFIRSAFIFFIALDLVLVAVIGIVSNDLHTENEALNSTNWAIIILCGILYIVLAILRISFTKTFPGAIANELKSERELNQLKQDASRESTINEFFVQSLQMLNGQTCALDESDEERLCDRGIKNG